jgi:choice-of-anchor A domain-containing protein
VVFNTSSFKEGATIVVNVDGDYLTKGNFQMENIPTERTVWNFYNAVE